MGRCSGRPYTDPPVCLVCRRAPVWVVVLVVLMPILLCALCVVERLCGSLFWSSLYGSSCVPCVS